MIYWEIFAGDEHSPIDLYVLAKCHWQKFHGLHLKFSSLKVTQ